MSRIFNKIYQKTTRISDFSKAVGYKINIQQTIVFLYTSSNQLETKNKYIIYNSIKNMKHLGDKSGKKYMKNLYLENHKTLQTVIRELNKWEDVSCSWVGRFSIVFFKLIQCSVNQILINFFVKINKLIYVNTKVLE